MDLKSDVQPPISPVPGELYMAPPQIADVSKTIVEAPQEGQVGRELVPKGPTPAILVKELSRKSRAFLELLVGGKSTLEAYELAGYKGSKHAAYQLRCDLRFHLVQMLEAHGVAREDVKIQLIELLKLPVSEQTVSVGTKLKLLKFLDKLTETQREKEAITPFLVNINDPKSVSITEAK